MSEWQPIETAPTDGTQILVCREYPAHEQIGVDLIRDGLWWRSTTYNQPTHWMPLPAPATPALTSKHDTLGFDS